MSCWSQHQLFLLRSVGVLRDRKMTVKMKGYVMVYRTVVTQALVYGAETCALNKAQENKLDVAEMRMLRWMCGVTKLGKTRNERIRGRRKWRKSQRKSRKGG